MQPADGDLALIWCPFETVDDARAAARVLVEERLVACANIVPRIVSVFSWQDSIEEGDEAGMLCKTRADKLQEAIDRLAELHPYDTPAIAGWLADRAPPDTLSWLSVSLGEKAGE